MRLVARIILATILLISQLSLGAVACLCPDSTEPLAKSTATALMACPITGAKNCSCCKEEKPSSKGSSANQLSSKQSDCKISVSQAPTAEKWASVISVDSVDAVLPEPTNLPVLGYRVPVSTPAHLVVPRIRPPDTEFNGLRAPPAR